LEIPPPAIGLAMVMEAVIRSVTRRLGRETILRRGFKISLDGKEEQTVKEVTVRGREESEGGM